MREDKGSILYRLKKAYEKVKLFCCAIGAFVDYCIEKRELEKADQKALIKPSLDTGQKIIKLIKEQKEEEEE